MRVRPFRAAPCNRQLAKKQVSSRKVGLPLYIGALVDGQTTQRTVLGRQELDLGALMFDLMKGDIQRAALLGQVSIISRDLHTLVSGRKRKAILEPNEPLRNKLRE
jgi:hypothetical protein